MRVEKLESVILYVSNLPEARGFYAEWLGMAERYEAEIIVIVGDDTGRIVMHRNDRRHDERGIFPAGLRPGAAALPFIVGDPDAWEQEAARRGAPVLWRTQEASWGRFVVVADPDGRPVVLAKTAWKGAAMSAPTRNNAAQGSASGVAAQAPGHTPATAPILEETARAETSSRGLEPMQGRAGVRRLRSVALTATSVVIIATAASVVPAGPAWAQKPSITCTGFSGTLVLLGETVGRVTNCSGHTDGWGTVTSGPDFSLLDPTRVTIAWGNSTWTTAKFVASATTTEKGCPANEFKFKAKGKVTGNTNDSTTVGQKFAFQFCESSSLTGVYGMSMPAGGKLKL